jgi:hypothetical protein
MVLSSGTTRQGSVRVQASGQPDPSKDHHGSQEAQTEISSADGSSNAGDFNRSGQLNRYDPDRGHIRLSAAVFVRS